MATLKDIQGAVTVALKAKDRTRADALRLLANEVQKIAKEDGNREAVADDVITAANRMIKRANETLSFLPEVDDRRAALDAEIKIVSEFLPQQMTNDELKSLISSIMQQEDCPTGKSTRGYVMKTLNGEYRGQFDNRAANDLIAGMVTA